MTPHPDSALPDTSIVAALRQMHSGHYLHLPVLTTYDKTIVGVVDVLQLTYSMLEQLSTLKGGTNETPLWHQLWSPNHDDGLDVVSAPGTASQYSDRRSDAHHAVAFVPQLPSSIVDEFTNLPSAVVFKIKHRDGAFLVTADTLQLPSLRELECEAMGRFNVNAGTLFLVDQDDDLIPIRDDAELGRFVGMVTSKGLDRVSLVLLDRETQVQAQSNTTSVILGAGLAVGLAAVGFFLLRIQKSA
jgi:CBS domain-containing protein